MLLYLPILICGTAMGQSYYSEYIYKLVDNKNLSEKIQTKDKEGKEQMSEMFPMPISATFSVKVISNEKYAYIKMTFESAGMAGLTISDDEQSFFVDYSKNLCYDMKTKSYFYSKPNKIKSAPIVFNDNSFAEVLIDGKDTAVVTFDKRMPKFMTNQYLFANNSCGVSKIQTRRTLLTLVKFQEQKFDLDKVAEIFENSCDKKTKDFNMLFLK